MAGRKEDAVSLIQSPEFGQRLTRRFNLRGDRAIAPTLSPEVMPVVIVDDVFNVPDWKQTDRRACAGGNDASGAPGAFPGAYLSNPAASGVIVLPRLIVLNVVGWSGEDVVIGTYSTVPALTVTASPGYLNRHVLGTPTGVIGKIADGPGPDARVAIYVPNDGETFQFSLAGMVLPPGFALGTSFLSTGANGMRASFLWDEIQRPPSG